MFTHQVLGPAGKVSELRVCHINPHPVIEGGENLAEMNRAIFWILAPSSGRTDHLAALHPTARQQGSPSKLGYYLDYVSGGIGYAALFIGIGVGLVGPLGVWAVILAAAGAASALISMFSNMAIDNYRDGAETLDALGYPGFAGFELEDGIYILGPVTWAGWLLPFFVAAGIGASVYCLWTIFTHLKHIAASR